MCFYGEPKLILKPVIMQSALVYFVFKCWDPRGALGSMRRAEEGWSGGPFVHCSLMVSLWKAPPVSGRLLKVNYTKVSEHITLL